jgi:type IV fimbrial biogenesis protein FimT
VKTLRRRAHEGLTLIELMVAVAITSVLLVLVAPSFREMIDLQRLRGTSAQMVTDVQYARTEAISRQETVGLTLGSDLTMTCYIVHTCGGLAPTACRCNCAAAPGSRCTGGPKELRTVQALNTEHVQVVPIRNPSNNVITLILFDPMTGGMQPYNIGVGGSAFALEGAAWSKVALVRESTKSLRTMISMGGRPSVCTPSDELVRGAPVCQ